MSLFNVEEEIKILECRLNITSDPADRAKIKRKIRACAKYMEDIKLKARDNYGAYSGEEDIRWKTES